MAIGQLVVKIIGDSSQLSSELGKAGKSTDSFGAKGRKAVNEFGKAAVAAFAAAGAAAVALTLRTAGQVRELQTLAQVSNTSVAELQRMAYASKTVGIEQDKLADILKDVNDRVGDFNATGGGPMADFFEKIAPKIGVTADQFKNLSGPQALQLYVDSLEKANLSQADMTFYMEAMASDSTRLLPLLKGNGAAMGALASEAEALGLGLSAVDVAKIELANNELGKVGAITDASAQALTTELMPIIGAAATAFRDLVQEAGGFGPVINKGIGYAVEVVGVFANALTGIQLIVKGLELGFEGFGFGVNRIFLAVSRGVDWLVNGAIENVNFLIESMNNLPGVAIETIGAFTGTATTFFENGTKFWSAAIDDTMQEMHDLAMEPLPSDGIKAWVADVQENAQQAAEAVAAAQQGVSPADMQSGGPVGLTKDESDALTKKLEVLRQSLMSERELMLEKYEMDLEDLIVARENKLITGQEYDALELDLFTAHMDELGAIEQDAANKRIALMEAERSQKFAIAKSIFSGLADLMNTGSRKMFEVGKAAALANAGVAGVESAVQAWRSGMSTGGPYAPVVAASYTAASLAKTGALISQIRSSSFGQSTTPVSFSGGVPTVPTSQPGGEGSGGGSGGGASRSISITLAGSSFGAGGIRDLIAQINQEIGDGVTLGVTGG